MLDVGDGHRVYWECCGNPAGKPAVYLHGGPGAGATPSERRFFDPDAYRVVLFDQRGSGRSRPLASEPDADLSTNTTTHLIADIERLRQRHGIDSWTVVGVSWGTTLALAYAQTHPQRVTALVLAAVSTDSRREIEWVTRDVGRIFPREWDRFAGAVPDTLRHLPLADAYATLLFAPDAAVREHAAREWCAWEDAVLSHETHGNFAVYSGRPSLARQGLVRICSHYFSQGAFLEEGVLIREAGRLTGIPGVLVHGRLDMNGPLEAAWELAKAWPDAELLVAEDAGHLDSETKVQYVRDAINRFAGR